MDKRKPWQLALIIAVVALTLYNILPTIFFYSNSLKEPIGEKRAEEVAEKIVTRVNNLEEEAVDWLRGFTAHLNLKPVSITPDKQDPQLVMVKFPDANQAAYFKKLLPRAGALIPFVPSQLDLKEQGTEKNSTLVAVTRQIGVRLDSAEIPELFRFAPKYSEEGEVSPLYRNVVNDRAAEVALGFAGTSKTAAMLEAITENPNDPRYDETAITVAKEIVEAERALGKTHPILKRWYAGFSQSGVGDPKGLVQKYLARIEILKGKVQNELKALQKDLDSGREEGALVDSKKNERAKLLANRKKILEAASDTVRKNLALFQSGKAPFNRSELLAALDSEKSGSGKQILELEGRNPFIRAVAIDWNDDKLEILPYDDVQKIRMTEPETEAKAFQQERLNRFVINEIARASSSSDETIAPAGGDFTVALNTLTGTKSILVFDLGMLAKKRSGQILEEIQSEWRPSHKDLKEENYPVRNWNAYIKEAAQQQKLGLVVYAPAMFKAEAPEGFHPGSLYIIARNLGEIAKQQGEPESVEAKTFAEDLTALSAILKQNGFIAYPGSSYGIAPEFSKDYIFELDDYYGSLVKATRENFQIKGSKRQAVLDFTDLEQRILTENRIDDQQQEELLRWEEEYQTAQVDLRPGQKLLVPPPVKSPFWENIKLTARKYFRGDERKILKWGLDLSGGKTVRIGLRDKNGRPVTNPEELNQAVNELYSRVNKMGVSERTIRIENDNIILDFPGSQGVSASDLIKASAMYFHIVNEKFSPSNSALRESVNEFLQNVWNEAVVTNRKDSESINEIAWRHLGGEGLGEEIHPRSENARILYENGLRLANPKEGGASHQFNDTLSAVAMLKGEEFSEWQGQTHPLLFVFHNYALEGSNLTDVRVGYDPSEGNILSFSVKSAYDTGSGDPRSDFYTWTSQFSEDQIRGTQKESYAKGNGWRMAVILNGKVISSPTLRAALYQGGTISGRFSQREVDQLAADLKAGSLSFTPRILSEQNVSPDLGKEERTRGIFASLIALSLVFIAMIGYYRFAGLVASCAVIFNILIMWGVLQNLGAALTLPGIAGIVLTIGMAVDANVLVFERFREEFKISGRIGSAIQTAYKKAFSAIVDSNVTTILAALILLQFDSGPIKGFALTLIIGIVSSMFTALFMTRYFFAGWVEGAKQRTLTMANWVGQTKFDFLGQAKKAVVLSAILLIAGGYLFFSQKNTMFGMDFTGGYSLQLEMQTDGEEENYRARATDALLAAGAAQNDVDIRELSRPTQLRIQLGTGLEERGAPFHGMAEESTKGSFTYPYQSNPRIDWVVSSLQNGGLNIPEGELANLDKNWTVMSGQFSDAMRNNAVMALSLALICILAYITLRFEFKYAGGAVIALAHDVLITLGIVALFHKLGFPVQINLEVIGAIMTIIGYSLNDTIIVFDRIREDLLLHRKWSFKEVINHAINVTLNRTLMTSGTTLLVLLALVLLGGPALFGFSLVMTIGVVVGTFSSLFIASPAMLLLHKIEERRHTAPAVRKQSGERG